MIMVSYRSTKMIQVEEFSGKTHRQGTNNIVNICLVAKIKISNPALSTSVFFLSEIKSSSKLLAVKVDNCEDEETSHLYQKTY